MAWKELRALASAVLRASAEDRLPTREWEDFRDAARASESAPPFHLRTLIAEIIRLAPGGDRSRVVILDHGCGTGYTPLYLAALGWTDIYSVDVGGHAERLNRLTSDILGLEGKRFHIYDGARLPLADASVDFVFSQQVLEHVNPAVYRSYLSEEVRVLREDGVAYHKIPQQLTPYESHTQTWFFHYLPLPAFRRIIDAISRGSEVSRRVLFLRWPRQIHDDFQRAFGGYEDRTAIRVGQVPDADIQEGSMALRRLIAWLICHLPVVGPIARLLLSKLMMLELVAIKRRETSGP